MTEEEIAEQLKQNIEHSGDTPQDPAQSKPVEIDTSNGQATIAPTYELDEITQYKLHDYFGEQYKPHDETARQQLQYIYEEVAKMVEDKEYGFVLAKIRDLEQVLGVSTAENRRYRLYQWLRLNNMRRNIDAEMGAITHG